MATPRFRAPRFGSPEGCPTQRERLYRLLREAEGTWLTTGTICRQLYGFDGRQQRKALARIIYDLRRQLPTLLIESKRISGRTNSSAYRMVPKPSPSLSSSEPTEQPPDSVKTNWPAEQTSIPLMSTDWSDQWRVPHAASSSPSLSSLDSPPTPPTSSSGKPDSPPSRTGKPAPSPPKPGFKSYVKRDARTPENELRHYCRDCPLEFESTDVESAHRSALIHYIHEHDRARQFRRCDRNCELKAQPEEIKLDRRLYGPGVIHPRSTRKIRNLFGDDDA
jgi:hypothetical protein